jgi:predicted phosphodiesterase
MMKERTVDFADGLDQVADVAIEIGADIVIHAGDLFDSRRPDPYSIRRVMNFVARLKEEDIPLVLIEGNHDFDGVDIEGNKWTTLLSSRFENVYELTIGTDLHLKGLKIFGSSWMQANRIQQVVDALPPGACDILVLHQSVSGFMPAIKAELPRESLAGKALYVALGDLHICKHEALVAAGNGATIVAYPGSTETCSTAESFLKSVNVIEFAVDPKKEKPTQITQFKHLPIKTRPFVCASISDPKDIPQIDQQLMLDKDLYKPPLLILEYDSRLSELLQPKIEELRSKGVLLRPVPRGTQGLAVTIDQSRGIADKDMPVILEERLGKGTLEFNAANSLWTRPDQADAILDSLRKSIVGVPAEEL